MLWEELILKKKLKYVGIFGSMLLAIAPLTTIFIDPISDLTVKADTTSSSKGSIDYTFDQDDFVSLGFGVNVDGQRRTIYSRSPVYAKNEGDIDTQEAPLLDGYVANPSTVSFQRTATGYRLLQVPTYTKSNPDDAPKSSTTMTFYEVIKVRNDSSTYSPLVGFSEETGKIFSLTNRALGNNTEWYSDKIKTYDGAKYYRVATNEWVKDTYFLGGHSGGDIGPQ